MLTAAWRSPKPLVRVQLPADLPNVLNSMNVVENQIKHERQIMLLAHDLIYRRRWFSSNWWKGDCASFAVGLHQAFTQAGLRSSVVADSGKYHFFVRVRVLGSFYYFDAGSSVPLDDADVDSVIDTQLIQNPQEFEQQFGVQLEPSKVRRIERFFLRVFKSSQDSSDSRAPV